MTAHHSSPKRSHGIAPCGALILFLLLALLMAGSCGPGEIDLEARIQRIGSNLVPGPGIVIKGRPVPRASLAERMEGQLSIAVKKERSRKLTQLCAGLAAEQNAALNGKTLEILVCEEGRKGNFQGRSNSYKPVIVKERVLGEFVRVEVTKAFPTYVEARLEKP